MKKQLAFLMMIFVSIISAQAQEKIDPEFAYHPYMLLSSGELKDFERADYKKLHTQGWVTWESYYTISGKKSTIRFTKTTMPRIVIKVEIGEDPSGRVSMLKGKQTKKQRRFQDSGTQKQVDEASIKIEFKKIHDGVYEIILPSLQPGEYALLSSGGGKISCFGIDE